MKELSIEEKARAYDEAIKRAKDFKEGVIHYELKIGENIMDYIFPELKESEDEKIRKWIINEIKIKHHNLDEDNIDFVNKAINWLEKQGAQKLANSAKTCKNEQNPTWSEEDEEHVNSLLQRLEGLCRNEFATTRFAINEDEDWLKSLKDRYTWKPSDEQVNFLEQWLKNNQYKGDARYCYPIFESLYQDLKKLREKQ